MIQHEQVSQLYDTVDRLRRQLDAEKRRTGRLVAAVKEAATEALQGLDLRTTYTPPSRVGRGDPEKALVCLGDLQLGKRTPTYNSKVCEERVQAYAKKVINLTNIQRTDHPVDEARVYVLGDFVEGELVFSHQPHQIDSSLFRQTVVDGPRILGNFIRHLLSSFKHVHVAGVIGNHGVLSGGRHSRHNPETNADRFLYEITRQQFLQEKRVTWNLPFLENERAWYVVDYPFGSEATHKTPQYFPDRHGFLLFHGDQIPGGANYSMGTIARHLWGYASGAIPEPFQYAIHGHYHTPRKAVLNNVTLWQNGSTESTNTFAQEKMAAVGKPCQQLLFASPRRVTAEYLVDL